jgi:hypothetical protein
MSASSVVRAVLPDMSVNVWARGPGLQGVYLLERGAKPLWQPVHREPVLPTGTPNISGPVNKQPLSQAARPSQTVNAAHSKTYWPEIAMHLQEMAGTAPT